MKLLRWVILPATLLLMVMGATAQDPNVKHYDKDGLSFDYPANWHFSDQSTAQMQFIEIEFASAPPSPTVILVFRQRAAFKAW